ncbi:hypothetical protein SIPHO059v1_p0068 [Vibrio phage 264E42.1]|nr:hypothetical protein SIPHO059v1_p0068 [Vibrio phage 264E42.1]
MKRKAKIKDTGEVVEIASSNLGMCRVRHIRQDKIEQRGKMVYKTSKVRASSLDLM